MPDPTPTDFDNSILFGTESKFGTLTGWNPQDPTVSTSSQVAQTANEAADITDAIAYDTRTEVNQAFKAASSTTPALPAALGVVIGGLLLTKISIKTVATDYVEMTLTGHNHPDNPHVATSAKRTLTHGITLTSGFGAQNFLGATLGDDCVVESSDLDITIEHVDILDGLNQQHKAGNNFRGKLTCKQVFRGRPTTDAAATWKVVPSKESGEHAADYETYTVTAEKYIALVLTPAPTATAQTAPTA